MVPEAFGPAPPTVSRQFIRASTGKLGEFMERGLDELDIVTVIIDRMTFKDHEMIGPLEMIIEGERAALGFIHTETENASVCKDFLKDSFQGEPKIEEGLLCVYGWQQRDGEGSRGGLW